MTKRIGDFSIQNTIGEGTFGKVRIGTHLPTGQKVAIKILQKKRINDKTDLLRVQRQLTILKSIQQQYIIKLLQLHQTDKNIYIITQLAQGIELYQRIVNQQKLCEDQARVYFLQLLQAVNYLHQNNIAHRDIKPENILVHNNSIRLIDFGLSKQFNNVNKLLTTSCGSPCYAAPQMLSGKKYNPIMTDIWAIGVTLYAMVAGKLPFQHEKTQKLYKIIAKGQYQQPQSTSDEVKDLISKILNIDANKRFTINQIQNHSWVKKNKQKNYSNHNNDNRKQRQQNLWNCALIDSMCLMFNYNKQKIIEIIKTKQIPSISTYYHLINKKQKKSQKMMKISKPQNIFDQNIKIRSITDNPTIKNHYKNSKQFQIYNGPIHFNYVFNGYEKVIQWINSSLKQAKIIEKNLINFENIEIPIKKISKTKQLFYLQLPFYLMTKN